MDDEGREAARGNESRHGHGGAVAERTQQLSDANVRLAELSVTDPLTGLANRRALEAHVEGEWRRLARAGGSLALVMLDVDHFKPYNDSLGHLAGDECLRRVAQTLRDGLQRPADLLARYGGEEFIALLPDTDADGALVIGRELGRRVRALAIPHAASDVGPRVTISAGETRHYFNLYRDNQAATPCGNTASTVNTTNAGSITWARPDSSCRMIWVLRATRRAEVFSPMRAMVSLPGPMKAIPASAQARANAGFSARKP